MDKPVANPNAIAKTNEDDLALALRTLALCGGSGTRASKILKEQGVEIPARTLNQWRTATHARRYLEVQYELQSEIGKEASARASELAIYATDVSRELVEKTKKKINQIEPRDLARSAQALTQTAAEQTRTGRLLQERPTSINEVRNPAELIKELQSLGVVKRDAITVEVEEVPPVQPPEDEPAPEEAKPA